MATYSTIPDLISSTSVSVDLDKGVVYNAIKKQSTFETIYPFASPQKSLLASVIAEFNSILRLNETKKILVFLGLNIFGIIILLLWCHDTNSMALTAYTYLTIFDCLSLLTCLLSIWVRLQKPTPVFSFGYERFEVLATFATTMLAQLGSLFIIKESVERIIQQPEIHTGRLLMGVVSGFLLHMFLVYSVENKALNHVMHASSSSWLQEHTTDISESLCHFIPGLSKLLLPRINSLALIAFAGGFMLFITHVLIDTKNYFSSDTFSAMMIAIMMCGTMLPMAVYTGKILLQTTPSHMLGQLDKVLREASTLDGVLEFREEHFWTLSFGTLAGSVQLRVRRDANEQLVLAHVYNRLANLVSNLTIQIFKDDWTRASTYTIVGSNPAFSSNYHYSGPTLSQASGSSPAHEFSFSSTMVNPAKQALLGFQHEDYGSAENHSEQHASYSPHSRSYSQGRGYLLSSPGQGHSHCQGHSHNHKEHW